MKIFKRLVTTMCVCVVLAPAPTEAQTPPSPPRARRSLETMAFPDSLEATFQKLRQRFPHVVLEPTTLLTRGPDTVRREDGSFSVVHGDTLLFAPIDLTRVPRTRFIVTNDSVVRIEPLPRIVLDSLRADVFRLFVQAGRELKRLDNLVKR